ncbi:alpha/beta fold hydrolase [Ramlibacter monticola]|uniref:Alpha/beta fold hydrolase n=1 Tax=Ramlibacter monticola TaxID=1926872 RepID=A0A936YYI6_9BURK|nr:alpha/beta fold hydrolase [Ramlibacter monticola]MBL0391778.1 alpha/beta fold hydrolase [Ramlibacter monticola]
MPRQSSIARLLQLSVLTQIVAAAAWAAWRWPVSPLQAVAGVALIVLLGPTVLAIEGVASAVVSRADGRIPAPTPWQLLRAWASESAHLFRAFWWRQPFRWRALDDHLDPRCAGRTGVVFVHGFMCNRGFWNSWMRKVRAQGHAYAAPNLEPAFGSIDAYAAIVEAAVQRIEQLTGRPPLVICHSMGGLAARAWWRAHGADRRLAGLVTIGSPHAGTWMGQFSQRENGRQMRLRSEWLRELAKAESRQALPATTCWYSNCDNIVFPAATAMLEGADNRYVPGVPHVALAFHPQVLEGTLDLLKRIDALRQGESVTAVAMENS